MHVGHDGRRWRHRARSRVYSTTTARHRHGTRRRHRGPRAGLDDHRRPLSKIEVCAGQPVRRPGHRRAATTRSTLKDAAGRTTQLDVAETITVTPEHADGVTTASPPARSPRPRPSSAPRTFTATGTTVGADDITLTSTAVTPAVTAKATLNVTKAAAIAADEVDIVTGADSWDGFGDGTTAGTTAVRVDQSSIRIDFKSDRRRRQDAQHHRHAERLQRQRLTFARQDLDHRLDRCSTATAWARSSSPRTPAPSRRTTRSPSAARSPRRCTSSVRRPRPSRPRPTRTSRSSRARSTSPRTLSTSSACRSPRASSRPRAVVAPA